MNGDDPQAFELLDRFASATDSQRDVLRGEILASRSDLAPLLACVEQLDALAQAPLSDDQRASLGLSAPALSAASEFTEEIRAIAQARASQGQRFGEYELVREIGRGGMGVVFEALQLDLARPVAVKMILSAHLADDSAVQRFQEEARLAARVQHPNIVSVHRVGQHLGQHYFAMDFIAGRSLAGALCDGPFDVDTAAACLEEVARAIDHLHAERIIHRDLKPSNILLDAAGRPYVTDFGLAKLLDADRSRTRTGAIVGTPSYMPPEQAAGRIHEIDARTDVYSLGAILYEMLTGRPPFVGETSIDILLAVLENQPEKPRTLNRRIPHDLEAICLKCLERERDHRYASAAALADDLARFLRREPVEAAMASPLAKLRRWSRRAPGLAMRLGGLGAAIVVAQIRYAMMSDRDPVFHLRITTLLIAWAAIAALFQRLSTLRRPALAPLASAARWLWTVADTAFLTVAISLADPPRGPLFAAYPLLIATSGLSLRRGITTVATIAALVCYAAILVVHPEEAWPPHYPALFSISTLLVGVVTSYQVQRAKLLGRSRAPLGASQQLAQSASKPAPAANPPEQAHTVPWE